jgi:hypothetical protein
VRIGQVPVTPQKLVELIGAADAHQSGASTSATQQEPSPLLTA